MKYLFGPVNSRRLGRSLGVDIIPHKTCTLDCIYCECGKTTRLTNKINEYVPVHEVIDELDKYLSEKPPLDNITFAGSGEPVLNLGIGKIVNFLKMNYPDYNVTILTNGTLLYLKEVRKSIINADIIIPSLDAVSDRIFQKINRPVKGITIKKIIQGLINLRKEYKGKIYLEIFIVPSINDNEDEIKKIKDACIKIKPDLVQLNMLDRPGTEEWVKTVSEEKLQNIKKILLPLNVDIAAKGTDIINYDNNSSTDIQKTLISTIKRRPSTIHDLSVTLGKDASEFIDILDNLIKKNMIEKTELPGGIFYKLLK